MSDDRRTRIAKVLQNHCAQCSSLRSLDVYHSDACPGARQRYGQPQMSDDLRTRIAVVLYEDGQRPMDTAMRLADAVISELGLTEFRVDHPVAERWWATKVEPIDD